MDTGQATTYIPIEILQHIFSWRPWTAIGLSRTLTSWALAVIDAVPTVEPIQAKPCHDFVCSPFTDMLRVNFNSHRVKAAIYSCGAYYSHTKYDIFGMASADSIQIYNPEYESDIGYPAPRLGGTLCYNHAVYMLHTGGHIDMIILAGQTCINIYIAGIGTINIQLYDTEQYDYPIYSAKILIDSMAAGLDIKCYISEVYDSPASGCTRMCGRGRILYELCDKYDIILDNAVSDLGLAGTKWRGVIDAAIRELTTGLDRIIAVIDS